MNSNHLDKDQNTYEVFKNEETGSIQFRFYLEDDDPQIFNKRLILNKGYFTEPFFLSYEKKFYRNGKLVYESYHNDVLQLYSEIQDTPECRIDQHFSNDKSYPCSEVYDNLILWFHYYLKSSATIKIKSKHLSILGWDLTSYIKIIIPQTPQSVQDQLQ